MNNFTWIFLAVLLAGLALQLWLAARSGGFHFEFDADAGDWRNTRDGSLLRPFVVAQMREQGEIDFAWL